MFNDSQIQPPQDELERNAYNAAFHDLGFRWYWDRDTYMQLAQQAADAAERIRHYLETQQAHLLRAYDANFLVTAIEAGKAEHLKRGTAPTSAAAFFDWAQMSGSELGA
jgi:hypothetical protein